MALALEYLHGEDIVHGDLHDQNVFVDEMGDVRIADFGLALIASGLSHEAMSWLGGDDQFNAPEVKGDKRHSVRRTKQSDVFSFAMICFAVWESA